MTVSSRPEAANAYSGTPVHTQHTYEYSDNSALTTGKVTCNNKLFLHYSLHSQLKM